MTTRTIAISPATIDSVSFNPASQNYDGAAKSTAMTVKAGALTLGSGDYDIISGVLSGVVGSPAGDTVTTVTVQGKGNFQGEKDGNWTIAAPTGALGKMTPSKGCAVDSGNANNVVVTESRELDYDPNTGKWSVGINVVVPSEDVGKITDPTVTFPDDLYVTATPQDAVKVKKNYEYNNGSSRKYYYMTSVDADASFSKEDVEAAADSGGLVFTVEIWAKRGQYNADGIRGTTYTLTVPIDENLKLNDQFGNQVYPDAGYVAQVGNIKYLQLADAIVVANKGDDKTVNLIGNAEAGTFSVGKNVTVNLGGYGNAGAVYMLDCDDVNLGAKVVSTKAEDVRTSVTGFAVKNENNTYTLYRAHLHTWSYALNGDTLTATCVTDDGTPCDQKTVAVQLTVSGAADGVAPTASLGDGAELFAKLTGASFGTVGYDRDTDDGAACGKWYVGDYTASLTVTVGGEDRTLTKAFSIAGTTADKYTSGYAVASRNIRYGTWAEALAAAKEGDTVYYRNGNVTAKRHYFSSDKNVTLDLGGATFDYDSDAEITIYNSGSGCVTLVNGTFKQARSSSSTHGITVTFEEGKNNGGSVAFGSGISFVNRATNSKNYMTVTADGIAVAIVGGQYEAGFEAKNGGKVTISGGQFWSNDKPTALAPDHIVREIDGSFKYEVVEHHHAYHYEVAGGVITATCEADDNKYCGFDTQTLTLTAATVKVADLGGGAYAGAGYVCTDKFPVKDAEITYWQGDQQLAGAPTDTGDYVAKVTVGEATAEVKFQIFHEHSYSYAVEGDSIVATCGAAGSCDAPRFTATLTANGATYTGSAYTGASTSVDEGYPAEVALTYWQGGQQLAGEPTNAGDYIAKMSAGGQTVEKAFTIAKADLASVTFALKEGEFTFDHAAHTAALATHALGGYVLVEGSDYVLSGDALTQVGSPAEDKTYTIEITAAGDNFTGGRTLQWTIKTPITGTAKFGAPSAEGAYGTVEGCALKVTDTTKMVYGNNAWEIRMTVEVPHETLVFTPTAFLYFDSPKAESPIVATEEAALGQIGISVESKKVEASQQGYRYAMSFTWVESITLAEVEAALANDETNIVRTVKAYAMPYDARVWGTGYYNDGGIPVTEFAMEIPLADLVLPVPAGQTLAAGDAAISGYRLQLGKKAAVTANGQVADFRNVIVPQEKSEIVKESGNGPYTYSAVNKGLMILFGIGQ